MYGIALAASLVALMGSYSWWAEGLISRGIIPDRQKGSNAGGRYVPAYDFYAGRAKILQAAARRQHIVALVARFRRETERWPRDGGELALRFGDRQRVPALDADHPALDYRLSDTPVAYLGAEGRGARMLIRVPDFDTMESVVTPDAVYPPQPVRL